MPTFEYRARDAAGTAVSGLAFASDESRAREDLTRRGLLLEEVRPTAPTGSTERVAVAASPTGLRSDVAVSEVATGTVEGAAPRIEERHEGPPTERRSYAATSIWGPLIGKVPLAQLTFFFRQLATMMHAGVPLVQALDTLARQAQSPKLKEVITEVRGHVQAGRPMSAGFQRYPEVFTPVMMSVLRIGEAGGFMDRALHTMADYTDREIELRAIYRRVTFLPKLELIFALIIMGVTNLIIGGINPNAEKFNSPLNRISTWFWLTPLLVGIFLFLRVGLANFGVKYLWDTFIIRIPYIGYTMRQLSMAKFGRAFGAMYKSGVPIPRAIELSADACGNEYMRARIAPAGKRLEGGHGVAATLAETNSFSPIVLDMVATGETTGTLDSMLDKVSEYYEQEATVRAQQTAQVFGVLIALAVMLYLAYVIITFWVGHYSGMMHDNT